MKTKPINNVKTFLEIANKERHGKRNSLLILMGIFTGLRISELLSLNIEDLKVNGEIVNSIMIRGKGKKTRSVPLARPIREILTVYLEDMEKGILFQSQKGKRLSRFRVYEVMQILGRKTSQSHIATHSMRKTFAQSLLDAGVDIETMRVLMGHSSIAITQRYVETDARKMAAAVEKIRFV